MLDSPQAVTALKTFAGWKRYVDPNTKDDAFAKRKVALSWVGHRVYPDYSKALGQDLVLLPLPNFGNGVKSGHGSWAWGISAGSKNTKAAGAFLDYLLADGPVTAMTKANGAVPGTLSALAKSNLYKPGGPLALYATSSPSRAGRRRHLLRRRHPAGHSRIPGAVPPVRPGPERRVQGRRPKTELTKAAKAIDTDFADNDGYTQP